MYKTLELLDLERTLAKPLFEGKTYPWEALGEIKDFIRSLGEKLTEDEYEKMGEDVWIAKDAKVFPSAYIAGPAIIGHGTEVRHCAFIRGSALIGDNCVIGNSVEVKNAVIFDNVQVPHYNYVGDSVLGYRSHMGAGSVTSNVKSDRSLVVVKNGDELIETGRKKFGAILGDYAEIGCNSVLNPGTVIGRRSSVYPTSCVRGVVPEDSIYKNDGGKIVKRK
ncbi:MAG: UDP-N-acetylglucosamine pyrophosphorylase [Oscillospiraceae bacterium]|nr:UDP-N-acetylglucosamine pyrophosphorylase [Oscillospiraceae bacterium]MBQ2157226.1 UDP-N-acetylglucosamine pyrophosphorylase [Oscillospiraceae bacterium]MBQ3986738.1 UDP-N-acetylglucosamine pyrophosphorylase [Oscillospiraceae bacterium]MBQ5515069.1 UDP-N-acetylglucosamine pyrophosphorylase [Oscillospiraceae bacterium]